MARQTILRPEPYQFTSHSRAKGATKLDSRRHGGAFPHSPKCERRSEIVERANDLPRYLDYVRVDHRRLQASVTEQ